MSPVVVCLCVPLCVLEQKSWLSAGPLSFWGIQFTQVLLWMLKRFRSVPLMGGPQGPSVSRSPGTAPQKRAGRPMGPSTPLCFTSKLLGFGVSVRDVSVKRFLSWPLVSVFCFEGKLYGSLSPSSFGPCFVFLFWFFWVPFWVGGASSLMTCLF